MALVDTYDPNKPLQNQVGFPIIAEGLELIVESDDNGQANFVLHQNGHSANLTENEAKIMAILMNDGHMDTREVRDALSDENHNPINVVKYMHRIRNKIEKGVIKTLNGSGGKKGKGKSGGYFIGKEPVEYGGYKLNTQKKYMQKPNGDIVHFNLDETNAMETVLRLGGLATIDELCKSLYEGASTSFLQNVMAGIRQKVGDDAIKTLYTTEDYVGIYYLDGLSQHRNQGDHVYKYGGFILNTLSRYIRVPKGDMFHLTGRETKIMEILIDSKGKTDAYSLASRIYRLASYVEIDLIYDNIRILNKRMDGKYININQLGNLTLTNTNI